MKKLKKIKIKFTQEQIGTERESKWEGSMITWKMTEEQRNEKQTLNLWDNRRKMVTVRNMKSCSLLLLIGILSVSISSSSVFVTLPAASATPTVIGEGTINNATQVIGNRFFANGTGVAYFSDGAVFPFNHAITSGYGFYYDDSTIFYAGNIPGITASKNNNTNNNVSGSNNNSSTNHNIVIPRGFEASSANVTIQPSVLRIKVGDTVRWVNQDWNSISLRSPPYVGGGSNVTLSDLSLTLDGINFDEYIEPGKTLSIQFTRAGGFHYEMSDVAGTIIVEER